MTDATLLWSIWQALLQSFAWAFTRPGHRRFAEWVTALALNVEEHTITQSVLAIERPADWKAMETFAEYGAWRRRLRHPQPDPAGREGPRPDSGTATTSRPSMTPRSTAPARTSGAPAPSTSTPPAAPTGPPPSGPTTGSSSGRCCENPGKPAWFLPISGRLYFRKSPVAPAVPDLGPHRAVPDQVRAGRRTAPGAGPDRSAVVTWRPSTAASPSRAWSGRWSSPEDGSPRIEFLTRLRHDARLYAPLPERHRPKQKWGRRLPPPRQGGRWTRHWHEGTAFIYGRRRKVRWKEVVCLWRVSGHDVPVKAVVARSRATRSGSRWSPRRWS